MFISLFLWGEQVENLMERSPCDFEFFGDDREAPDRWAARVQDRIVYDYIDECKWEDKCADEVWRTFVSAQIFVADRLQCAAESDDDDEDEERPDTSQKKSRDRGKDKDKDKRKRSQDDGGAGPTGMQRPSGRGSKRVRPNSDDEDESSSPPKKGGRRATAKVPTTAFTKILTRASTRTSTKTTSRGTTKAPSNDADWNNAEGPSDLTKTRGDRTTSRTSAAASKPDLTSASAKAAPTKTGTRAPSKAPPKAPTRASSKTEVNEDDPDDADGAKTEVEEQHGEIAGGAASAEQIQKKISAKVRQNLGLPASRAEADSGAETGQSRIMGRD